MNRKTGQCTRNEFPNSSNIYESSAYNKGNTLRINGIEINYVPSGKDKVGSNVILTSFPINCFDEEKKFWKKTWMNSFTKFEVKKSFLNMIQILEAT